MWQKLLLFSFAKSLTFSRDNSSYDFRWLAPSVVCAACWSWRCPFPSWWTTLQVTCEDLLGIQPPHNQVVFLYVRWKNCFLCANHNNGYKKKPRILSRFQNYKLFALGPWFRLLLWSIIFFLLVKTSTFSFVETTTLNTRLLLRLVLFPLLKLSL
jgi:hypothetical protein